MKKCKFCGKEIFKHVYKEGSRKHVISYSSEGRQCSEPNCEINHKCKDKE